LVTSGFWSSIPFLYVSSAFDASRVERECIAGDR
jgi:hypothetical protein